MDWDGVRRLALSFPETTERLSSGTPHWYVRGKAFVWDRPLRKRELAELGLDDQPGPILGARTDDLATKSALLHDDPDVFFTTAHFDGWPIVLARLDRIADDRVIELTTEAWLAVAPDEVAEDWILGRGE